MATTTDVSVDLCGVKLKNPLILASGFVGVSASSVDFAIKNGAGAVTIKSVGNKERVGHSNPMTLAWGEGIINCVGLFNPGVEYCLPHLSKILKKSKAPIIISFFADTSDNFVSVAEKLARINPQIIELNISCPNTEDDLGRPFALSCKNSALITKKIRYVVGKKMKIWVKLSPNVTDIADIAQSVEQAGADAIVCANTVNGMLIDVRARKPTLTNKVGGISGPAILPIALRNVYVIYKKVKIPIIGVGGVTTGEDALAMIMAGATAVGVGSAIYYRGFDVFKKIAFEMKKIMKEEGIKNVSEIKGAAHE